MTLSHSLGTDATKDWWQQAPKTSKHQCQHGLLASTWSQVIYQIMGIQRALGGNWSLDTTPDPSLHRATDPDMALCSSPGPNNTVALGNS